MKGPEAIDCSSWKQFWGKHFIKEYLKKSKKQFLRELLDKFLNWEFWSLGEFQNFGRFYKGIAWIISKGFNEAISWRVFLVESLDKFPKQSLENKIWSKHSTRNSELLMEPFVKESMEDFPKKIPREISGIFHWRICEKVHVRFSRWVLRQANLRNFWRDSWENFRIHIYLRNPRKHFWSTPGKISRKF